MACVAALFLTLVLSVSTANATIAKLLDVSTVLLQHSGRVLSEDVHASLKLHPLLTRIADNRFELHSVNVPTRRQILNHKDKAELQFRTTIFGEDLTFLLKHDGDLFAPGFQHHHEQADGTFETKSEDLRCFFHGFIKGNENSTVSINFCEESEQENSEPLVSGLIHHNTKGLIALQPLRQHGVHAFYHVSAMEKHGDCHGVSPPPFVQIENEESIENEENGSELDIHRQLADNSNRYNGNKIKRVKFLVVNDVARYNMLRGNTHAHSSNLMQQVRDMYLTLENMPDAKYQFHVQIVGMVTYAYNDPWEDALRTNSDGETMSSKLNTAFNRFMADRDSFPFRMGKDYTAAHLLSGLDFDGSTVGFAMVGGACSDQHATGVNQAVGHSDSLVATTIVHELAHNLGAQHTHHVEANTLVSSPCKTDGVSYVMDASGSGTGVWSTCTLGWFQMHIEGYPFGCKSTQDSCLHPRSYGVPGHSGCMEDIEESSTFAALPQCGNGLVESGEECDCGEGGCDGKDACCDGATCRLTHGSTCSALDQCCDRATCLIISEESDIVCREAKSNCDIEERCNGRSAKCPADSFLMGSTCEHSTYGFGACFKGECRVRAGQCDTLSGKLGTPTEYQVGNCLSKLGSGGNAMCKELQCNPVGTSLNNCILFQQSGAIIQVLDGTPCNDDGEVCFEQKCVPVSELKVPTSLQCSNGVLDLGEADVDCGGDCFPCSAGKSCFNDVDCFNATDNPSRCEFPSSAPTVFFQLNSTAAPSTSTFELLKCNAVTDGWDTIPSDVIEECNSYSHCTMDANNTACMYAIVPELGCMNQTEVECSLYKTCMWLTGEKAIKNNDGGGVCERNPNIQDKERSFDVRLLQTEDGDVNSVQQGICRSEFTPPERVYVPGRRGFLGHWDNFTRWVKDHLQLAIPLLIGAGLIFLWVLLSLIEYMCCRRDSRRRLRTKRRSSIAKTSVVNPLSSRSISPGRDNRSRQRNTHGVNPLPGRMATARVFVPPSPAANATRGARPSAIVTDVESGGRASTFALWSPRRAIAAVAAAARTPRVIRTQEQRKSIADDKTWDSTWHNSPAAAGRATNQQDQIYARIYADSLARQTSPLSSSTASSESTSGGAFAQLYPSTHTRGRERGGGASNRGLVYAQELRPATSFSSSRQPTVSVTPPLSPSLSAAAGRQQHHEGQLGSRIRATAQQQRGTRQDARTLPSSPVRLVQPKCTTCNMNFANPLRNGSCNACHHARYDASF